MCGIVGIAGDLSYADQKIMKHLLLFDYIRGQDSTGLAAVEKDGRFSVAKVASHPIDLFDMGKFKSTCLGHDRHAFIGHNRAKTSGDVTSRNAHPFVVDHIVGVHNGTLSYTSHAALEDALGEKFDVDSEAIFAAIARLGIEDAVKLMTGAWSLVYYNAKEHSLNFLRNEKRPLYVGYAKDFKRMFYASEWPLIDAAIQAEGVTNTEIYLDKKGGWSYFPTTVDLHYRWDLERLAKGGGKPAAKMVEMKGKEEVAASAVTPFRHRGMNGTSTGTNSNPGRKELIGDDLSPYAGVFFKPDFLVLAKDGCSFCSKPIKYGDAILYFENEGHILGQCCSPFKDSRMILDKSFPS